MSRNLAVLMIAVLSASPSFGQGVALFQDGVTDVPGGGKYEGTIDTEFRAAAPTTPQFENIELSIDQFDGGFQTQGAIRFDNLLVSNGGLVPDELGRGQILFAEFRLWKTSPSESDANIDFSRVVGPDTSTGAFWDEEDTWASLGGDLIPDEFGLLDGDPISRDGVEAATTPDFQDSPSRFGPGEVVVVDPNDGPVASSLVYGADIDSADIFGDAWDGSPEDLDRAIDVSFFRFDVTEAVRDWIADTNTGVPGTQALQQNFGWAITNDTGDGWDILSSESDEIPEAEFEGMDAGLFRPALTIIFDDGSAGPLDIDKDSDIDVTDFNLFVDLLGSELDGPLVTGSAGDFDFNRKIDLEDFKFFKENFPGGAAGLQAAISAAGVPEPTSCVLAIFAMAGLVAPRRRSNS
ncbi:hypothetical protein [Adhaeretor mobilis]|uniref:PEP-CTERM protein-sorting domain-containing protein n=1 Tax=Adhaeretor mobilis TaxID=1930276 RepID=A0A517MPX8_9BACT|nr:hypothetical protein [Adhaeretor mobilis]QDS96929.1 hypothetical protein HG15A2_01880 [Adhaeretor mobilis]